ncbi:HAMP domain-containing sensor histidine kinase [Terriglobus saanensis]|nr:HAMP domain-containing sensor histidine kinase [Terriglobus saanensis]
MFRVRDANGKVLYQPDAMAAVKDVKPPPTGIHKESQTAAGHNYQTISRMAHVGPYVFSLQVAVDQTGYGELMERLALLFLFCIPLAACAAAAGGYWMSGRVLAPVHLITATANTIDAKNLQRRLALSGNGDELDQLSITINSMLDRIAASYDRIAQFTGDASHELRGPVALVRSTAELLMMDAADVERVRRGLTDILTESDYMTRLIADLLTLARNGLEENTAGRELFELGASVAAMTSRATIQADLKQIRLDVDPVEKLLPIHGNQVVVERVLMILLDNAIRYTPSGGRIVVKTWSEGQRCGYTVSDTGIGIAREHHSRVFERFYRVNTARTHGDGSSGLGLAIARSLVELHGGSIHLDSEPGQGSSFEISFAAADFAALPLKSFSTV